MSQSHPPIMDSAVVVPCSITDKGVITANSVDVSTYISAEAETIATANSDNHPPCSIADTEMSVNEKPCDSSIGFKKPLTYCAEIGLSPSRAHVEFRIHPWRLLIAAIVISTLLVVMTFELQRGFSLATLKTGHSLSWKLVRNVSISDQIDDLNSYSGNATSALGALWGFALQMIVYVLVLAISPSLMFDNSTMWAKLVLLAITGGVGWFATQGFVATNVQLKPMDTIPYLSFADLNGFDANLMNNYQNYTPYSGDTTQISISTLLRSAVAGTNPRETATCSVFDEGDHTVSALFGFSNHEWLQYMLPNGSSKTAHMNLAMNQSWSFADLTLPMYQKDATTLAIFSLEMTDVFFAAQKSNNVTCSESLWNGYGDQTPEDTNGFLGAYQDLIWSTFTNEKEYFKHFSTNESSVEFTKMNLSDNITFDAITLEIPLKRNFFSRSLTAHITSNSSNGGSDTLTYNSTQLDVEEDEDAIYEMAVWDDCNTYGCMLSGLDEVNAKGVVTYPESQVLAIRICLDADGNEDILGTISNCYYGHSNTSFVVFSIASRIEGEAMNIDTATQQTSQPRRLGADFHELVADDNQTETSSGQSLGSASASDNVKITSETPIVSSGSIEFKTVIDGAQSSSGSSNMISGDASGSKVEPTNEPGSEFLPGDIPTDEIPPNEIPGGDPTTSDPLDLDPHLPEKQVPVEIVSVVLNGPTAFGTTSDTPAPTTLSSQTPSRSGSDKLSPAPNPVPSSNQSKPRRLLPTKTRSFRLSPDAATKRATAFTRKASIKNARKIYTITVGILSWEIEDLAQRFGATCITTHNRDCQGLAFNLTNITKQLVVGHQYVPTANLRDFSGSPYLWTTLAKIKHDSGFGGDFAPPKAFKRTNWPVVLNGTDCKSSREEYLMSILDNHFYSQHSLQPAYTASLMWLFQYGTANEIIDLGKNKKKTLAFSANIVQNRVFVSTPSNSSYFTYGACGLIVILSAVVSFKAYRQNGARPDVPVLVRTVAEVMMNANQYPPAFLTCYVHSETQDSSETEHGSSSTISLPTVEPKPLQEFEIRGLQLGSRDSNHHQWFSDGLSEKV